MLEKGAPVDKSTAYVVSAVLTTIAGIAGYLFGRRNDAERTAAALLKQAEHAEQKAFAEKTYTLQIEATAAARKAAAEAERQEAARIAAMTPDQRTAFEAERNHKEIAELARIEARHVADAEYARAAAEARQADAAEEMVRETRRLRREISEVAFSNSNVLPSRYARGIPWTTF